MNIFQSSISNSSYIRLESRCDNNPRMVFYKVKILDVCKNRPSFCTHLVLIISFLHLAVTEFKISPVSSHKYEQLADLNLGVLIALSESKSETELCAARTAHDFTAHSVQVREYNWRSSILDQLKLMQFKPRRAILMAVWQSTQHTFSD